MKPPRWTTAICALAVCGLTAACGNTSAYQQRVENWQAGQPPGTPAENFPLVDGTYRGTAELVAAQGMDCPAPRPGNINIGDRWLVWPYQPNLTFVALARPDGTLTARNEGGSLDGKVGAGSLEFTVHTPSCESRYKLRWLM